MAPEPPTDRRQELRFEVEPQMLQVDVHPTSPDVPMVCGNLLDISCTGCAVELAPGVNPAPYRSGEFHIHIRGDNGTEAAPARERRTNKRVQKRARACQPQDQQPPGTRCSFAFRHPARLEAFGYVLDHVVGPVSNHPLSLSTRFRRQREIAYTDVDALEAAIRDLKGRQFQILLAGLPLFIALLGTTFSFLLRPEESANGPPPMPWWLIFLPLSCMSLSIPLFAIFLQKTASSIRQEAFVFLLQRYAVLGGFPRNYRGWHEAYAIYNRILRHGRHRHSNPLLKKRPRLKAEPVPQTRKGSLAFLPANAFVVFITFVFLSVPLISGGAVYMYVDQLQPALSIALIVLLTIAILLMAAYGALIAYGWRIARGVYSFRNVVVQFSLILEHGAPYDPTRLA